MNTEPIWEELADALMKLMERAVARDAAFVECLGPQILMATANMPEEAVWTNADWGELNAVHNAYKAMKEGRTV